MYTTIATSDIAHISNPDSIFNHVNNILSEENIISHSTIMHVQGIKGHQCGLKVYNYNILSLLA